MEIDLKNPTNGKASPIEFLNMHKQTNKPHSLALSEGVNEVRLFVKKQIRRSR